MYLCSEGKRVHPYGGAAAMRNGVMPLQWEGKCLVQELFVALSFSFALGVRPRLASERSSTPREQPLTHYSARQYDHDFPPFTNAIGAPPSTHKGKGKGKLSDRPYPHLQQKQRQRKIHPQRLRERLRERLRP